MATDLDLLAVATDGIQTGITVFGTPVIPITAASLGYLKPEVPPTPPTPDAGGRRKGGRSTSIDLGKKREEQVIFDLRVSANIAKVNKKAAPENKKTVKTYRYAKDTTMDVRTLKLIIDKNKSNQKVIIEDIDTTVFTPKIVVEAKIKVETKGAITVSSSLGNKKTFEPKIIIKPIKRE